MSSKTCNVCNLTLDISEFYKHNRKCKKCLKKSRECRHGVQKHRCKKCIGNSICEHRREKRYCNEGNCDGNMLCKHGREKRRCNEDDCDGNDLCKHGRPKNVCNEDKCNGSSICKHGIHKRYCRECGGSAFCIHHIIKARCPKCGGSAMCIHCKYKDGRPRYVESLDKKVKCCARCFYHFYPNDEIPRRFKMKQHYFNEKLIEEFGADFFQYDKKIKCGCSGRKPDWFIDCFKYSIIIELDEEQHKYESCDEKRMMELFTDLGNRPLVLIRINPDKYEGKTKKRKGCFDFDKRNILICNEKKFNKRFNILVEMIKYFIDNEPEKEITMEKLFFDRK